MPSLFDSETDVPEERKVLKRHIERTKNHVYFDRTLRGDLSLAECRI